MSGTESPTAAAPAGAIDGSMQLATRMTEAAESAALAAQAAASMVTAASLKPAKTEWYKMLPKPPTFSPSNREEELSMFREWEWQLEQYLLAVDAQFGPDIEHLRNNLSTTEDLVDMNLEKTQRSTFLFGLLASLLKGRPCF